MSHFRKASFCLVVLVAGLFVAACPVSNPGGGGTVTQDILDMEEQVHNLINTERTNQGLGALTMNTTLRNVARSHSQDQASQGGPSTHDSSNGDKPWDRLADAGVTYTSMAENVASNSGYADPGQQAVTQWMGSPGHAANILTPGYTKTGVGVADAGAGKYYFTQVFTAGYKYGEPVYLIEGYWLGADGVPVE